MRPAEFAEKEYAKREEYRQRVESWGRNLGGIRILDFGAGPGQWGVILRQLGVSHITWHDIAPEFEEFARSINAADRYVRADLMETAQYGTGEFELVLSRGALHYAKDEWRVLDEVARMSQRWIYIESPSWRWTWRGHGLSVLTPAWIVAGLIPQIVRYKPLPSRWLSRRFVYWRLRRNGFRPVWERFGLHRQSWWTLFERGH